MRALVTGVSGFIGAELAHAARARGCRVTGTFNSHPLEIAEVETVQLDVRDEGAVDAVVASVSPDWIFHAAASAQPDRCAEDPIGTHSVNVRGTQHVVDAAARHGAKVVFLSTDLVFDGEDAPYDEKASPSPLGIYARSKAAAERIVHSNPDVRPAIARLALTYGRSRGHRRCFAEDWLVRLREGQQLRAFADQFRTPLWIGDGVEALLRLCERNVEGVVHLGGPDRCSRLEFAQTLAEVLGVDSTRIQPSSVFDVETVEPRPRDASLSIDRLRGECSLDPLDVRAGLDRMWAGGDSL